MACSRPPAHSRSSQSVTLTGHWAVSLLFFRIPRATKKSSSVSYFAPSAVALAELPQISGCHCVLAARWKVFPSLSSDSLDNPGQTLLPRDEGPGSPLDERVGRTALESACCLSFWGEWEGRRCHWQSWRLGKSEQLCSKPLGSAARLNKRERIPLLVF